MKNVKDRIVSAAVRRPVRRLGTAGRRRRRRQTEAKMCFFCLMPDCGRPSFLGHLQARDDGRHRRAARVLEPGPRHKCPHTLWDADDAQMGRAVGENGLERLSPRRAFVLGRVHVLGLEPSSPFPLPSPRVLSPWLNAYYVSSLTVREGTVIYTGHTGRARRGGASTRALPRAASP